MSNLTDLNIWGKSVLPEHLARIAYKPTAPRLRRLTLMQVIPEEYMPIIPVLVRAHPMLTELRLWPTLRAEQFSDSPPGFSLDRSDAPRLRSFTGSLPVLGNLLQDKDLPEHEAITHATIASPILLHEHFEALEVLKVRGSSLRSFQCHVVVANWHAMEVIAKALPQLEVLKLHVLANFKRDKFMSFISQVEGLEQFTKLRELHLNSRDVTVLHRTAFRKKGAELETVLRLGLQCPTLEVITMPPYRRWVRNDESGTWNILSGQELHEHISFVKTQLGQPNDGQLGRSQPRLDRSEEPSGVRNA
ncbi:F-box-like protein [Ceratobasidium sp. AG-Ba]|nr:F-box-like protein [Ceratobasidium sp. AG-Ba]